ncbi:hypothetical protein AS589_16130 [Empedobacter brevis]|uniref:T9SS type A sorting domain-containing protein n=1 Tax=Flavobacteriales TaxID=200644 RepID=UPI00131FF666|nr:MULTISPECIES: T9SS type A sorting domain-containing protein [Flavobacteriales]QHC86207.1 hypothetical protein AS589_16130 [Empedobacter brevis]
MKNTLKISVLILLFSNTLFAQQWQIPGTIVAGGNDYGSDANQLAQLMSVTVDNQGNVFVPDLGNNRIQKWTPGATEGITIAGGIGNSAAADGLFLPTSVLIDENNTLFISDAGNNRVQMWPEGATEGITVAGGNGVGSGLHQLNWQGGIFKKGNDLFIVDSGNSRILKWTIGNTEGVIVAGGNDSGSNLNQLGTPTLNGAIYVDDEDNIYVTEYNNARVTKWVPGASEGIVVAGGSAGNMTNPSGIWVLDDGKILVSDFANSMWGITLWENGEFLGYVIPIDSEELIQPTGIFLDANQNLYVANYGQNSVKKINFLDPTEPCETPAPTGEIHPNLPEGSTLADIEITGENITWYADEELTQPLDMDTELENMVTYYATQTIDDCESEEYLAVMVHLQPLSVNDFDLSNLKIYPNPVKDILNISSEQEISGIEIFNLLGQQVLNKKINMKNTSIDASEFPRGNYILNIKSASNQIIMKIVKQ